MRNERVQDVGKEHAARLSRALLGEHLTTKVENT